MPGFLLLLGLFKEVLACEAIPFQLPRSMSQNQEKVAASTAAVVCGAEGGATTVDRSHRGSELGPHFGDVNVALVSQKRVGAHLKRHRCDPLDSMKHDALTRPGVKKYAGPRPDVVIDQTRVKR